MNNATTAPPILLPGGAGYLGRVLAAHFTAQGRPVVVLTRRVPENAAATGDGVRFLRWDGETLGDWAEAFEGAAAIVNLAGKSVNCRYNEANKQAIYDSRLRSTKVIGEAIARCAAPPPVWLNASSATIYRHAEDRPMDEATGEIGTGFSVDVCQKWEAAFFNSPTPPTVRKVALRTSMVFGPTPGGVLDMFRLLARVGLAGPMAGGRQYVSWIHETDFARAVEWLLMHDDLSGPVNVAGPNPLPNADFLRDVRQAFGAPFGLPSARWMLEIGAWAMRTETELLLKSRRVIPGRLLASGFTFRYPMWRAAVAAS